MVRVLNLNVVVYRPSDDAPSDAPWMVQVTCAHRIHRIVMPCTTFEGAPNDDQITNMALTALPVEDACVCHEVWWMTHGPVHRVSRKIERD